MNVTQGSELLGSSEQSCFAFSLGGTGQAFRKGFLVPACCLVRAPLNLAGPRAPQGSRWLSRARKHLTVHEPSSPERGPSRPEATVSSHLPATRPPNGTASPPQGGRPSPGDSSPSRPRARRGRGLRRSLLSLRVRCSAPQSRRSWALGSSASGARPGVARAPASQPSTARVTPQAGPPGSR